VSITAAVAALANLERPAVIIDPLTSTTMTKSLGPVEPEEYLKGEGVDRDAKRWRWMRKIEKGVTRGHT